MSACLKPRQLFVCGNRAVWKSAQCACAIALLMMGACSWPASQEQGLLFSGELAFQTGPTPIPAGEATGSNDLTVSNSFFAISFGVDTASPWGVARGGILDIGVKRNGAIEPDFVSLVDFMPNNWSAWPTSYQRVAVEAHSTNRVVVLTERDWGDVALETRFEVFANLSRIRITTAMHNRGDVALKNLRSGYIAWPTGGNLFGMPGLPAMHAEPIDDSSALARWSASYDRHWAMGLHTTDSSMVGYGGRDRYWPHELRPGERREFSSWLQVLPSANLAEFVTAELALDVERKVGPPGFAAADVHGAITDTNGQPLEDSVVVVQKNGVDYCWALARNGRYSVQLPAGHYQFYPTAAGFGEGQPVALTVENGQRYTRDFSDIQPPAMLELELSREQNANVSPAHAVVSVLDGPTQSVKYFGATRFFTELDSPGFLQLVLSPGVYQFSVGSGAGFFSLEQRLSMQLEAGEKRSEKVVIRALDTPEDSNWFSADLHHHSDVLDGFTEPEYVMRSQLSAALDVAFLSDHDSTVNNAAMSALARERNMPFIAGTELSASWAHFNAYPIDPDKRVRSSIGALSVQQIFSEARRLGADVIHVNHPYGNYGYFSSLELDAENPATTIVPGGYDAGFDMIEVTGFHDDKTSAFAWDLWNLGKPAYFVAGSDVHDVWNVPLEYATGFARTFVHVSGELTVANYIRALKAGHSYTSQGPLIYPELLFGSNHLHAGHSGALRLKYFVQAVDGLKRITLVESGKRIDSKVFQSRDSNDNFTIESEIEFTAQPDSNTWYSVVVENQRGKFAYSNPLWVTVAKSDGEAIAQ